MNTLEVIGRDNRSDSSEPGDVQFGFVNFNDDRRVGYTSFSGVEADATGGWGAVTEKHVRLAEEYLREQGVLVPAE